MRTSFLLLGSLALAACGSTSTSSTSTTTGGTTGGLPDNADAITYMDDLATHPGCSTYGQLLDSTGLTVLGHTDAGPGIGYTNATITGYPCAAKEYLPAAEDTTKPIVILIHGNADDPTVWETCNLNDMTDGRQNIYEESSITTADCTSSALMLSETLNAAGYHAFAVDLRYDLVPVNRALPATDPKYDPAQQFDHSWAVPIAQAMVTSLYAQYPTRKFAIVAHSLGVTIGRDLLRRMDRAGLNPYARLTAFVGASGGNHGIIPAEYDALCGTEANPINTSLSGASACQLGSYKGWTPAIFEMPISGVGEAWETPCVDGSTAFGQTGVCGGNTIKWTTVVDADNAADGSTEDEIVDESAAALMGANNLTIPYGSVDSTGYFYGMLLEHHFSSVRSAAGIAAIMGALAQ